MRGKQLSLVWALLLLIAATVGQGAELAHRWGFNGDLVDSVGGQNAVIVNLGGDAVLSETQVTLAGGGKDSTDYIALPSGIVSGLGDTVSVQIWAMQESVQNWSRIFDFGTSTTHNVFMSWTNGTALNTDRVEWLGQQQNNTVNNSNAPYTLGVEFHIVVVFEPGRVTWYTAPADSDQLGPAKGTFETPNLLSSLNDTNVWLGRSQWADNNANASYNEVRLWVGALTEEEREFHHVMGPDIFSTNLATFPSPQHQSDDVMQTICLRWTPGDAAVAHDVYLGTVREDVGNASRADPRDVLVSQGQIDAGYTPPVRLDLEQTYYWRVDGVDATGGIAKGVVWEFTIEPRAYLLTDVDVAASVEAGPGSEIERIVDGSGLRDDGSHWIEADTMWKGQGKPGDIVTVDFGFDRIFTLDEMLVWNYNHMFELWLNYSVKDVTIEYSTDAEEWTALGDYVFPQSTGPASLQPVSIDFGGGPAKFVRFTITSNYGGNGFGLSEVQFYWMPMSARGPKPEVGATVADPDVVLSWRPGREAVLHEVHFSSDSNAVAAGEALVATVDMPSYDTRPLNLMLDEQYYWMIVEVNEAETPPAWASDVWSFSTPEFIVVDDFEGYDDQENLIDEAWADGSGIAANGSQIGHDTRPYAEWTIVHSGRQSMPFNYGQGGTAISEATLTLDAPQDWTRAGVEALVFYVHGSLGNDPVQVHVEVNGTQVYSNNVTLAAPFWQPVVVDLAPLGNAARSVTSLTIGVSGAGAGLFYVDDVRLYRDVPDPGTASLMALYEMENNLLDSSGNGYDGVIQPGAGFGPGPAGYGNALVLDGAGGYAELPISSLIASLDSATFAVWVNWSGAGGTWQRIFDFGSGTEANLFLTPSGGGNLRFAITAEGVGESRLNAPPLTTGWHHVAVAIDGDTGTMAMYRNGAPVASATTGTVPSELGVTTQNWIGRSQYAADAYFDGAVDDLRIYDRVLSEPEIRYLVGDR